MSTTNTTVCSTSDDSLAKSVVIFATKTLSIYVGFSALTCIYKQLYWTFNPYFKFSIDKATEDHHLNYIANSNQSWMYIAQMDTIRAFLTKMN